MTHEELKHWLAIDAPADPAEVARVAVGVFDMLDDGGGSRSGRAFGIIRTYWLPRFPAVDVGDLLMAITDAVEALTTAEKAQEVQREAARRQSEQKTESARRKRIAAERKAAEERAARAERVKLVMERLGVCDRQARSLVTHGTTIRQRAEQLAEVLGGEPRDYMRRRARPGRQPDLAGWFMRVRAEGLSFQDYADTFPKLDGRAKRQSKRYMARVMTSANSNNSPHAQVI